jgi:hypothetical protein
VVHSGTNRLGPGIDVKADGGYIVAAPSIHPKTGQPYRWTGDGQFTHAPAELHRSLSRLLTATTAPSASRPRDIWDEIKTSAGGAPFGRFRGLVDKLLTAQEGNRNATLLWAAEKAGEMTAAGLITEETAYAALYAAAERIGLTPAEIGRTPNHGTFGSGFRRGLRRTAA